MCCAGVRGRGRPGAACLSDCVFSRRVVERKSQTSQFTPPVTGFQCNQLHCHHHKQLRALSTPETLIPMSRPSPPLLPSLGQPRTYFLSRDLPVRAPRMHGATQRLAFVPALAQRRFQAHPCVGCRFFVCFYCTDGLSPLSPHRWGDIPVWLLGDAVMRSARRGVTCFPFSWVHWGWAGCLVWRGIGLW